jgi:hypothetical protein
MNMFTSIELIHDGLFTKRDYVLAQLFTYNLGKRTRDWKNYIPVIRNISNFTLHIILLEWLIQGRWDETLKRSYFQYIIHHFHTIRRCITSAIEPKNAYIYNAWKWKNVSTVRLLNFFPGFIVTFASLNMKYSLSAMQRGVTKCAKDKSKP